MIPSGVSEWKSLSAKDSSLTFRAEITNGSLLHEDGSFRLKIPQQSQQMAVSFSRRQFAHFLSRQGQQMAVSPSRRQFVPLMIGKWQSFPKKRQFVCSGMFSSPQS